MVKIIDMDMYIISLNINQKNDVMAYIQPLLVLLVIFMLLFLPETNVEAIKVKPGKFNNFNLNVPEKVSNGESFIVKIMAQDSYGNLIADFSESGKEFALSSSVPATIQPLLLTPSLFENGVAKITVTARDAGKLSFFISDISTGKKIQHIDIFVDRSPGSADLKETRKAKEIKKPASRPTETAKKEASAKPAEKDKLREPVVGRKEPESGKKQKTAAIPPVTDAKTDIKETAAKAPENKKGEKPFSISDISILEAGEKALLVIKSPSASETPEYKKTLETRQGKKVIKVRLNPAVKKTDSLVKFQSELIGDIHVEEDIKHRDTINLYIELKTGIAFSDIAAQKDALIVMISRIRK